MEAFDIKLSLPILAYSSPVSHYETKELGTAKIHKFRQSKGYYPLWGMRGYIYYHILKPITITSLKILEGKRWKTWMVDDVPQNMAMEIFAENCKGKVLTSGLGLGLILHHLAKNNLVTDITVIERNRDVIDLISPYLPQDSRVKIICGDYNTFVEGTGQKFDDIILDLWTSRNRQQKEKLYYSEVIPLVSKTRKLHSEARISVHGFVTISDIQVVQRKELDRIHEMKPYG